MKNKFLNWLLIAVFAAGFISCGDDDDPTPPPMGDKSDLIGTYNGSESIFLTNLKRDTINSTATVQFSRYSQDASKLMVSINALGGGIQAYDFRITNDAYTFNLTEINLSGLQGGEIPDYIKNWFTGPGKDYDTLEKVDIKLAPISGNFDRKTNKMSFTYSGDLTIYPKIGSVSQEAKTYKISYKYVDLVK